MNDLLQIDRDVSAKLRSMKIGVQGSFYPAPPDMPKEDITEWQIRRLAALGCTAHQIGFGVLPDDEGKLLAIKALADSLGVELELTAPGAFGVSGPYADAEARQRFLKAVGQARLLGVPVVRTGYGRLNVSTSRFNRSMNVREHLDSLVPALREAGHIAADAGVGLAVENHCDFTGREMGYLLDQTDLANVGAALDTANGFTVFCDPQDDIEALAPYAFTTHMKDMAVVDMPVRGYIPMTAQGCGLGEGHVDLSRAIDLLARHSPRADGLHLLIEPGWMAWDPNRDQWEQEYEYFAQGIRYLQALLDEKANGSEERP
ncbi:sugar phosphate isomerase/epimerase [Paenibacillus doosanensis]|uniref:Xylose isomerase-like TIM barrel n=1 Tax=Paenibacillus konkukensis TaxID=2020716 RepID=A0ABY4RG02_9BACL|nr:MULTISPECIES: sugar phosphate isomerase/epimerase [Paenibacillus]MCS7461339.1 sugar phosphate isomerase/epimerase [Paenibacillus doosanensis]UQZ81105.1 Xylose isomerase-like TIM barrel [Paenibacillus konkukensis]